jgi:hypothetical protein
MWCQEAFESLLFSRCLKPRGWATVPFMWDMSRSGRRLLAPTRLLSGTGSHSGSRRLRSSLHSCGALVAKPGLFSYTRYLSLLLQCMQGSTPRWFGGSVVMAPSPRCTLAPRCRRRLPCPPARSLQPSQHLQPLKLFPAPRSPLLRAR